MEAKLRSEEHESYQAYNGDECAKQHEVIRACGIGLLYVNMADIWSERDMTLSREVGLVMEEFPSNNESQEVSRGRSSEEVSVMEMERRAEQIYQLLK